MSELAAFPVISEVIMPGNLASFIVPEEILDAFNVVSPDPLPVITPSTDRLSLTKTDPAAESNVKLPEDVVMSLSASIPSLRLSI